MNTRWKADGSLVVAALIWGSTFVVVKNALADATPMVFIAMRFALATAILVPLAWHARWDRRLLAASAVVGACMFGGYAFQTAGLRYTTPSKSAFITALSVVLVPVFLAVFFRRLPAGLTVFGVAVATTGLYFFTIPAGEAAASINHGDLLTLACAVIFAFQIITIGHYAPSVSPVGLTAGQSAVTFFLASAAVPWVEPPVLRLTPGLVVALVTTACLATALAFFIQVWAQQHTSATHAALIISLEPVFAWLTSWIVEGERLGSRAMAGAMLILVGIALAELSPQRAAGDCTSGRNPESA